MSFKIAFIGAGSIGFTRKLITDILSIPEFSDVQLALMDINKKNLDMIHQLIARDIASNKMDKVRLVSTTDRKAALKEARYVINIVRIGGLEAFAHDVNIPLKYGVDQCVGDTLCAGGIFYGQRVINFMLELCRDIKMYSEENALMLNYSNPNAMVTWAANTYGGVRTLGLCHGVQNGHRQLADALKIPEEELVYCCVGINHVTWYTRLNHQGHEYTTDELIEALENHPEYSRQEKARIDILKRFGCYSTESNGHLSEYLPWYRKRGEEIREWISLDKWIHGETAGYLRHCTERRNWFEEDFPRWMEEDSPVYEEDSRSVEHGSRIIEALETGRIYRGHFNVINNGTVTNLPDDCVVEVPCFADKSGIAIPRYGELPDGPAAICLSNISVQRLSVKAALSGDDFLLRQAMMLDPLVGAVCNPPEISQMVDEMLVAEQKWLPQYKDAVKKAEQRLGRGNLIPHRDYKGAARLAVKSIDEIREDKNKNLDSYGESGKKARKIS